MPPLHLRAALELREMQRLLPLLLGALLSGSATASPAASEQPRADTALLAGPPLTSRPVIGILTQPTDVRPPRNPPLRVRSLDPC